MSLRKNTRSRRKKQKSNSTLAAPLPIVSLHDNQILSFLQWCRLNYVSERTGRRIIRGPDGPVVTKLSSKRIGISVSNNRAWQDRRASKEVA